MATTQALKDELRRHFRSARRQLTLLNVVAAGAVICARIRQFAAYHRLDAVVSYLSGENEVSPAGLNHELAAARRLFLPRAGGDPAFVRWQPDQPLESESGRIFGIVGGEPLSAQTVALILLPLVAWDESGIRLGRGGGFYDRALSSRHEGSLLVGLAYESQHHSGLPADPWDVRLDYVVTERRVVCCAADRLGQRRLPRIAA